MYTHLQITKNTQHGYKNSALSLDTHELLGGIGLLLLAALPFKQYFTTTDDWQLLYDVCVNLNQNQTLTCRQIKDIIDNVTKIVKIIKEGE